MVAAYLHTRYVFWYKEFYTIIKCLRLSAVNTLSEAMGFKPRNVVRLFSSANDITSNNFAIHSSANELLTEFIYFLINYFLNYVNQINLFIFAEYSINYVCEFVEKYNRL